MNIYISSAIKKNIKDVVDLANKLNTNIEICNLADSNILDGDLKAELNKYQQALEAYNGIISLHGPFVDINPASKDSKIATASIYRYNQALHIAKTLNAKTMVFHTGYNGMVKAKIYHDKFIEDNIHFWQEFIKGFEDESIMVVLENTYENTPEVINSIINTVNSEYLKACIDTGHVNINSDIDIKQWIDSFGENLRHMHLHNNYGDSDTHQSLLSGTLDFKEIISYLHHKNLKPNLNIEIFHDEPALESFEFLKAQLNLVTQ